MRQLLKSKKNFHRTLHSIYIYSISHYNYHYLYSQNPVKQKIIFFSFFSFSVERHPVVQKYLPATMLCGRSSLKLRNPCSRSSLRPLFSLPEERHLVVQKYLPVMMLCSRSSLRPLFSLPEERHLVVQKYLPATMLCSRSSLKLRNLCSRSSLRPPFFRKNDILSFIRISRLRCCVAGAR